MKRYDVYDEKGSRKGEIRDEECGREGANIYDERGNKIGEIKPDDSMSGSSGAGGCVLILVGLSLVIAIIKGPTVYFKALAEGKFFAHFIAEVAACIISVYILRKREGNFVSDFIVSMLVTGIMSVLELCTEMMIWGELNVGNVFLAIFFSIFMVIPFALFSSLIVWFIR